MRPGPHLTLAFVLGLAGSGLPGHRSSAAAESPSPRELTITYHAPPGPERAPEPAPGAPCGRVDRLDFPLGDPNADGFGVRWPFGRVSRRYGGKLHTGEDWLSRTGPSLGTPVHSVGHGQVTYAAPLGWGRDKGVVIVRHVGADGESWLSFYGHLDPPSVVLHVGDCVARGDPVGRIGKPTTTPHLHFEIRHRLAGEPGPGYWPSDPTQAGWEEPTLFILANRVTAAPGVVWHRTLEPASGANASNTGRAARVIAQGDDGTVVVLRDAGLAGLNPEDGSDRWTLDSDGAICDVQVDPDRPVMVVATCAGEIRGYAIPPGPEPLWSARVGARAPDALALDPAGRPVVRVDGTLIAYDNAGAERWRVGGFGRIAGWALGPWGTAVALRPPGPPLALVTPAGRVRPLGGSRGAVVAAGDHLFVAGSGSVSELDPSTGCPTRVAFDGPSEAEPLTIGGADGSVMALGRRGSERVLVLARPAVVAQAAGGRLAAAAQDSKASPVDPPRAWAVPRDLDAGSPIPLGVRTQSPSAPLAAAGLLVTTSGALVEVDGTAGTSRVVFDVGMPAGAGPPASGLQLRDGTVVVVLPTGDVVRLDPVRLDPVAAADGAAGANG